MTLTLAVQEPLDHAWSGAAGKTANDVPGAKWDHHFLGLALKHSDMSKDPRTRVGCVIVNQGRRPVSDGFNGFPRGIADTPERLHDRALKLDLMVHAEMNAILNAAASGVSLTGTILYLAATDDTGEVWGGAPCATNCMKHILQTGIVGVVSYPPKASSDWAGEIAASMSLMREVALPYREVAKPPGLRHVRMMKP